MRRLFSVPLLFCIAVELLLATVTLPKLHREWRMLHWTPTPAVVIDAKLSTRADKDGQHFEPLIRFRYMFNGVAHTNDSTRTSAYSFRDAESAQRLLARYPVGSRVSCYVNPQASHEAVLTIGVQYWVLIMFLGPVLIWAILDFRRISEWWEARQYTRHADELQPLTANVSLRKANRFSLLISLMCLVMASLFSGWTWIWPIKDSWSRTRAWQETPCVIEGIRITSSTHHNGVSFTPEVTFHYSFDGRNYVGSRLDCSSDIGLGRAEAERRLKGVRVGPSRCFVNPDNPVQAVLRRAFYIDRFFGPFSAAFLVASIVMVFSSLRSFRKRRSVRPQMSEIPATATLRHLPPALLLAGSLIAALACAAAAVWVGWLCWQEYRSGVLNFLEGIYVFMFLAGTAFCLHSARVCWWGLLSPPPRMNLMPGVITLGGSVEIAWSFPRDRRRSDHVRFWLEGREEAIAIHWVNTGHGQMKEEKKERAVFAIVPIVERESIDAAREGVRRIMMPGDSMHSFDGVKTKIRWLVRAQRIRPRGEPIEYDFPVEVRVPAA